MKLRKQLLHTLINQLERTSRVKTFGDLRLSRYWSKINNKWDFIYYRSSAKHDDKWMARQVLMFMEYKIPT